MDPFGESRYQYWQNSSFLFSFLFSFFILEKYDLVYSNKLRDVLLHVLSLSLRRAYFLSSL